MKIRLDYLAIIGLIAASCSNDVVEEPQPSVTAKNTITYSPSAVNRTLDEAIKIANEAKGMLNNSKASRADVTREIDLTDGIKYVVSDVSRSNPDTLLYILNYKDNAGFAVISTRRSTEALLAVTESGTYTTPDDCDNPGFNMFMDMATAYVANAPVDPPTPPGIDGPLEIQECKTEEIIWADDTIPHRVEVEWDQTGFYGDYCKNGIAGCNNVAAAMTMSYFEHPKSINLTYDNTLKTILLDWQNIKRHKSGIYDFCCQPKPPHETIAQLLRELGERSNSDYSKDTVTGTTLIDTWNMLNNLGYKLGNIQNFYTKCIKHCLGDGIIIIAGLKPTNHDIGHVWISDGYLHHKKQVIQSVRPISSKEWIVIDDVTTESMFNWFNWGWTDYSSDINDCYNRRNGYYNDAVFKPRHSTDNYAYKVRFFTVNI